MVKIVKPAEPYEPRNGNIDVYGKHSEYLMPLDWDELATKNPMPIRGSCAFSINPWTALIKAGVEEADVTLLKEMSKNYCPCTDMYYYALVPIAILTSEPVIYTGPKEDHRGFYDMISDGNWNRMWWNKICDRRTPKGHMTSIEKAILGSGYTNGILPSDGINDYIFATIPLDNDDKIIVIAWEWYNK